MTSQVLQETLSQVATILVVEDDPDIQQVLTELLTSFNYHVLATDLGRAAIDLIEHEIVDLVVLDLMLPDIDGFEVCRQIRQNFGTAIPIVMLTAKDKPQNVVEGLRIGADDYVQKPFLPDELLLRVQRLVRRRQEQLSLDSENGALREMLSLVRQDLQASQLQKTTESLLRSELLHNVTTHLQSLVGIVEAEMRKLPPGVEREAMLRVRSRVRGAALIYQISQELQAEPVAIGNVITTVASALKAIYRPWKRIVVDVVESQVNLPSAIAAPVAMIANELITNCFKHAFPENRFGTISIVYGVVENTFFLDVGDDGIGMATNGASSGSGRATIAQLVQSLRGNVEWTSSAAGTRVSARIPLPSAT
jgi:DNA-binding response OmpR family regulator/anti-sigma regulatory factor (Ser/Thr protein kinase)